MLISILAVALAAAFALAIAIAIKDGKDAADPAVNAAAVKALRPAQPHELPQ